MKGKRKIIGKGKIDLVEQSKTIDERPQRLKAVVKKFKWMIYHRTRKNQKTVAVMTLTLQVKKTV